MLGRLARWLRMLGFDTVYERDVEDRELVRRARLEGRVLLTRDRRLVEDFHLERVHLLKANEVEGQLRELGRRYDVLAGGHGRCTVCNGELAVLRKREDAFNLVPEHVYLQGGEFSRCRECGRVYWEGSHRSRFVERVREVLLKG